MAFKHTVVLWMKMKDDIPFFTPNRKGLLFCFKAKLSSSGLQNKKKKHIRNYVDLLLCLIVHHI